MTAHCITKKERPAALFFLLDPDRGD